jgi:hypothetical protein
MPVFKLPTITPEEYVDLVAGKISLQQEIL